jgi:hypothetical protein
VSFSSKGGTVTYRAGADKQIQWMKFTRSLSTSKKVLLYTQDQIMIVKSLCNTIISELCGCNCWETEMSRSEGRSVVHMKETFIQGSHSAPFSLGDDSITSQVAESVILNPCYILYMHFLQLLWVSTMLLANITLLCCQHSFFLLILN